MENCSDIEFNLCVVVVVFFRLNKTVHKSVSGTVSVCVLQGFNLQRSTGEIRAGVRTRRDKELLQGAASSSNSSTLGGNSGETNRLITPSSGWHLLMGTK